MDGWCSVVQDMYMRQL